MSSLQYTANESFTAVLLLSILQLYSCWAFYCRTAVEQSTAPSVSWCAKENMFHVVCLLAVSVSQPDCPTTTKPEGEQPVRQQKQTGRACSSFTCSCNADVFDLEEWLVHSLTQLVSNDLEENRSMCVCVSVCVCERDGVELLTAVTQIL